MTEEPQLAAARRLYSPRAESYNDSWHRTYAVEVVALANLQPGQRVLDLACGTGLVTFAAAERVAPTGSVVGVDATAAMLAQALARQEQQPPRAAVAFHLHDIADLGSLAALRGQEGSFDVVTLACALVLFPDPAALLQTCARFVRAGGLVIVDVPHPQNQIGGALMEQAAGDAGVQQPYYRSWVTSQQAVGNVLTRAGLSVVRLEARAPEGFGVRVHPADAADAVFDGIVAASLSCQRLRDQPVLRDRARAIFRSRWAAIAAASPNGCVDELDCVWVAVARKPTATITVTPPIVLRGACRCGTVRYSSTHPLTQLCFCHCRSCQQLSGGGSIAFADLPAHAVTFAADSSSSSVSSFSSSSSSSSSSLATFTLSPAARRTFCSRCGSPLAMHYADDPDTIAVTLASVDPASMRCPWPTTADVKHIFVDEKADWDILPDDGAPRFARFPTDGAGA